MKHIKNNTQKENSINKFFPPKGPAVDKIMDFFPPKILGL